MAADQTYNPQSMTFYDRFASRLSLLSTFVVTLVIAAPIASVMFAALLPADAAWQHLTDTVLGDYIVNTVLLMVLTIVACQHRFERRRRFPG